jgi:hypothetical protein
MDVIGHDLDLKQLAAQLDDHFLNDLFQSASNRVIQHATPILGAPNDMVGATIGDIAI